MRLEPLRPEHAKDLWPAADEPELWKYMLMDVRTPQDLSKWIAGRLKEVEAGTALVFLQRDAKTGVAFGSTSLFDVDLLHKRMEVGHTWIGRSHRRTAANTEAKLLVLAHAFEGLDANRVQLKCDARNLRSRQAILRIGATFEGILRSHMVLADGHRRDTAFFSILREEWPSVKARLRTALSGARTAAAPA